MNTSSALKLTGGLSNPSKMPGRALGLPAAGAACPTGAKLARIPGTVCHECYATRNMYVFPVVKRAQLRRYRAVLRALKTPEDRDAWIDAMARLIGKQTYFRWHDSGDIFSLEYLEMLVDVVRATPDTRHWLPTRELLIVRAWQRKHGSFPANLTVRLSLPKIDSSRVNAEQVAKAFGLTASTVSTTEHTCPAPTQGNACGECRQCWDPTVNVVTYAKH